MELTPFLIGVIIVGAILSGIIFSIGKKMIATIIIAIAIAVFIFGVSFQDAVQFTSESVNQVVEKYAPTIEEEMKSGKYVKEADGTEKIESKNFSIVKTAENDYQITISAVGKTYSLKEFLSYIPDDMGTRLQELLDVQFTKNHSEKQ